MIKSKPCTVDGCSQPRWAKGFCKKHQALRVDGKAPKKIKKISEKGKQKKELKKELVQNDMAFYLKIWLKRPHKCEECGCNLESKPKLYNFDHILEKQSHPKLRHVEDNIQLLCLPCHSTKTNGILSPRMKELIKKLNQQYGSSTTSRVLPEGDDLTPLEF